MSGTLVMKSKDRWYRVDIDFRGNSSYVIPILEKYWNVQEGADRIIKNCGCGILMIFERVLAKDIPEGTPFASWLTRSEDADTNMSAWHNGEQFDHSSNACLSPVVEHMSKMVLAKGNQGPEPIKESFATKDEATAKFKYKHVYVWDGEKWSYEPATGQSTSNPFKRKGNRWGRN